MIGLFLFLTPLLHAQAPDYEAWKDALAAQRTTGLLVVQHGKTAYEWYAPGWDAARPHGTASMAKALVGGMSLLLAMNAGRIDPDDLAAKYIPAWRDDPQKSKITIRQLATHTSGIADAEQDGMPHDKLPGWKGAFWRRDPDPFSIAIHQAPVLFAAGTSMQYSNPGMAALAYAVTAALKTDIKSALASQVMEPLGIAPKEWSIGYGRAYEMDGLKLYANWGGGSYTARAVARVAELMLRRGNWEGRQLIDAKLVDKMTAYAGMSIRDRKKQGAFEPASGLAWWINYDGVWPAVPRDAYAGAGAGHEVVLVVPSLDLIVVRNGDAMKDDTPNAGFFGPVYRYLFAPLMPVQRPSPVIKKVTFAPESKIVRQAIDSDNWPITWGDDDAQYTSYGDGWGFEPRTERKLSLGFARIEGPATNFRGVNIRSASGERTGDGAKGLKTSGMLMADGVLYMWVRNAGNSQLAWSEDRGRTWQWGFKFDTSFASPAFLNFGRNYTGARDNYVYTYSQDGASAYESSARMVLARVDKHRMRDRSAYECFVRDGEWTSDINRRGAVFSLAGRCQRADVVYNPGLKRYLMALGYDHHGGWGLYDAPEPWGPWTVAFQTDNWGLGGTHGYRLPAKWISADGRTMQLVFSGVKPNDAFCVREMVLSTSAE